jgi:hypothetical protein
LRLEHRAIERAELEKLCSTLRLPGDFDVAQISWRADYDPFFYHQLSARAAGFTCFATNTSSTVVVETPQLNHATYVFAKPRSIDSFLAVYTGITKDDIRRNRKNIAEKLGFLGRVIHGTNPERGSRKSGSVWGRRSITLRRRSRSESGPRTRIQVRLAFCCAACVGQRSCCFIASPWDQESLGTRPNDRYRSIHQLDAKFL